MSLNLTTTASNVSPQGNAQKPQSSLAENIATKAEKSATRPSDTVSLTKPAEQQQVSSENAEVTASQKTQKTKELDSDAAFSALHLLQKQILNNPTSSLKSQANNRPEVALDLLKS